MDGAPVRIQLWDTAGQVSSIKAAVSSGPVGQGLFSVFEEGSVLLGRKEMHWSSTSHLLVWQSQTTE